MGSTFYTPPASGGAALSTANDWTATQTFNPTNIVSSAAVLKQKVLVATVISRDTGSGKGFAATYFTVANTLLSGATVSAYFTGVAGFANGFYTVYVSGTDITYDGSAISGSPGGTITIYQYESPLKIRNYNDTSNVVDITGVGNATFAGTGTFGGNVSVTGSVTATGTIAATKLNMSSTSLTGVTNGGWTSMVNSSDYNIAANTWDSFDGSGWKTFASNANNTFLVNGILTVRTQAANTAAKVTVKVMLTYGSTSFTLVPILSAEATIPAMAGVNGVATIPLNGLFQTSTATSSKYIVVEVYSTAAITVKATVPDNATGNITGPFGYSYLNDPTASASYVILMGVK